MEEEIEILDVVDEEDRIIGALERNEVHQKKLLHRSVHIFVITARNKLYLQFRAANKAEHPEKWDSSAAGHVSSGESYIEAAHRELQEELGLSVVQLRPIIKISACENTGGEHSMLYLAKISENDQTITPDPQEIIEGRFFPESEIKKQLRQSPEKFTPSFHLLFQQYLQGKNEYAKYHR